MNGEVEEYTDKPLLEKTESKPPKTLAEEFNTEVAKLLSEAGTLDLTDEQKEILYAPVDEDDVEIDIKIQPKFIAIGEFVEAVKNPSRTN